jgi:hypothetical protein
MWFSSRGTTPGIGESEVEKQLGGCLELAGTLWKAIEETSDTECEEVINLALLMHDFIECLAELLRKFCLL